MVAGDGGFQMTMCELATMVQEELDVKIAVINNGYLGMVRQWQEFFYQRRYAATPISGPDFAKLAESFGISRGDGHARASEVAGVVAAARRRRGALIDFRVEQEDSVFPMVPAGADLDKMIRRPSPSPIVGNAPRIDERSGPEPLGPAHGSRFDMQTFAVYVDNKPGVLNRVASLFRRRAFNIESLTVGHTETRRHLADDDRRRHRRARGAAGRGQPLQAHSGSPRGQHHQGPDDCPRPGADQGRRPPATPAPM